MNPMTDNLRDPHIVFLLGIPFHDVTLGETLAWLDTLVAVRQPCYLALVDLEFASQAGSDVELQRILFDAELVLCGGKSLLTASRWLGAPLRELLGGADFMAALLAHCTKYGHSIFFLGSNHEEMASAVAACRAQFPGIDICGAYAPPGEGLLDLDNDAIAGRIADAQPDILLVAMGCPKQEKWIYMNYQKLGVPVSIGIGEQLDFLTGKASLAPAWMRRNGIDWLYWLLRHPRRLFSRHYLDLLFFVTALRRQRKLMKRRGSLFGSMEVVNNPAAQNVLQARWHGRVDAAAVGSYAVEALVPEDDKPNVVIDCSNVTFMDSTGLGLFIKAFRECSRAGGLLVVLSPSEAVEKMLSMLHLTRLIPIARNADEVRALLPSTEPVRAGVKHFSNISVLTVEIPCDITAATVANCESVLVAKWEATPWVTQLQIDLAKVSFLDSSGLGFLVKALRVARKRGGGTLELLNISPNVRNVIKLANLEAMFGL